MILCPAAGRVLQPLHMVAPRTLTSNGLRFRDEGTKFYIFMGSWAQHQLKRIFFNSISTRTQFRFQGLGFRFSGSGLGFGVGFWS